MKKILLTLTLLIFLAGCDTENPGGVLTNNQLPISIIEFIDEKNILDDEYIIAYYDTTMSLDNSESAILTNKNVIYYKNGINDVPGIIQLMFEMSSSFNKEFIKLISNFYYFISCMLCKKGVISNCYTYSQQ